MKAILLLAPALLFAYQPTLINRIRAAAESDRSASIDGNFRAEVTRAAGDSVYAPIDRFVLRDSNNSVVYEKSGFGHTTFDLANTGAVVGIDLSGPADGRALVSFYSPVGEKLGSASVGFLQATAFSASGSVYCVQDGVSGLRVFSPDGTELYNLGTSDWFAVSDDGDRIVLIRGPVIVIFIKGAEVGRVSLTSSAIRQVRFSADGDQLVVAERRTLSLYRLMPVQLQFKYVEPDPGLDFVSADIAPDNPLIAAGLDETAPSYHTHGLVCLFDAFGRLIWQDDIRYDHWVAHIPDVSFGAGRRFQVRTAGEVIEYRY